MKHHHQVREALWHIAQEMATGCEKTPPILPDADLFFYLKTDEAIQLMRDSACPRAATYLAKAKLRRRLYPQMDVLRFDEFIKGFRMAPRVS